MYETTPVCVVVLGEGVDPEATAQEHARAYGFSVLSVRTGGVRGYSARLPQGSFALLGRDPRVRRFRLDHAHAEAAE